MIRLDALLYFWCQKETDTKNNGTKYSLKLNIVCAERANKNKKHVGPLAFWKRCYIIKMVGARTKTVWTGEKIRWLPSWYHGGAVAAVSPMLVTDSSYR